tara:strand:+ start:137 stop:580 length:444 start_codon:yes stop_codon:yes gene_type:complete
MEILIMYKSELNKLLNIVNTLSDTIYSFEVSDVSSAPRTSDVPEGTIFQRIIGRDPMSKDIVKIIEVQIPIRDYLGEISIDEKIYDFVLKQISFDYKCHLELENDYQKLSIENRELKHKIDLLNEYDYKPSCLDDELVLEDLEGDLS